MDGTFKKEDFMKKNIFSKFIKSIEPSVTFMIDGKVKEMQRRGVKVYNFNLGEPDFPTSDNVKSAAIKGILENRTKYTPIKGMPEILGAISEKFRRDNDLIYAPSEIMVSNGAKQILYSAVRTICEMGNEIIVLAPYWVSYPAIVKLAGGKPVIVKTDDFRFSAKKIKKAITRKTKAIIINSPNNPTSIVWTREELKELAELVLKHKIFVISDEVYEKFLYENAKHYSFASHDSKLKDYTITVNAVSKTYCMTGWRIGYCGAPKYIVEKMIDLQSHLSSNACSISQVAAIEALLGDQEPIQKMVRELDERRRFVCNEFENLGIEFIKSEGAFYVFFRVEPKFSSLKFCEKMLQDFQVALNPGESFGTPGWVRLSYTVNFKDLKEGMNRIKTMFERR